MTTNLRYTLVATGWRSDGTKCDMFERQYHVSTELSLAQANLRGYAMENPDCVRVTFVDVTP